MWLRAARRFGKRPALLTSYAVGGLGAGALALTGPGMGAFALVFICVAGSAFGAITFLILAMKADVIDYDGLHTGKRREAQYTSFWAIVQKFVQMPSAALPIALLGTIGYAPNQPQTPEVLLALRLLMGLAPALCLGAALLVMWRYPIGAATHAAILRGIAAHGRGEAARDPLTARRLPPPRRREPSEEISWFLDHFSSGELRRALARGSGRLLRDVAGGALAALFLCALASLAVWRSVADLSSEPGVTTVVGVFVAGVAFTAFLSHGVRLFAARRWARASIAQEAVRAHLCETPSV